jgi:hypothetical protein
LAPSALAELKNSTGKSQLEEMAAYRARVAEEKKLREEKAMKEKLEAEAQLRSEYEKVILSFSQCILCGRHPGNTIDTCVSIRK